MKIIKMNFDIITIFCYVDERTIIRDFGIKQQFSNSFGVDI